MSGAIQSMFDALEEEPACLKAAEDCRSPKPSEARARE